MNAGSTSRGGSFGVSVILHCAVIAIVAVLPKEALEQTTRRTGPVALLVPVIVPEAETKPLPVPQPKPKPLIAPPPSAALILLPAPAAITPELRAPAPELPKPAAPAAPETAALPAVTAAPAAPAARMAVKTGVFGGAEPATMMSSSSKPKVQIGGFAAADVDQPGAPASGLATRVAGFSGAAVRRDDAVKTPGTTAPAGFGSVGTRAGADTPVARATSTGGFGAAVIASAAPPAKPAPQTGSFGEVAANTSSGERVIARAPVTTPVEILFKPRPGYTEEGRKLKIEGEVIVEILFTANGETKVLRVVRGLGHGLDENALEAAARIRFRPAQRDGRPIDTVATARITFQLAY